MKLLRRKRRPPSLCSVGMTTHVETRVFRADLSTPPAAADWLKMTAQFKGRDCIAGDGDILTWLTWETVSDWEDAGHLHSGWLQDLCEPASLAGGKVLHEVGGIPGPQK